MANSSGSSVTNSPPSPAARFLVWLRLKPAQSPARRPSCPCMSPRAAWAASSITARPCRSAIAWIASMSAGRPCRWTGMIAAVRVGHPLLDPGRIDVEGPLVDVAEHRHGAVMRNRRGRRDVGVRGDDHLVPWGDAQGSRSRCAAPRCRSWSRCSARRRDTPPSRARGRRRPGASAPHSMPRSSTASTSARSSSVMSGHCACSAALTAGGPPCDGELVRDRHGATIQTFSRVSRAPSFH